LYDSGSDINIKSNGNNEGGRDVGGQDIKTGKIEKAMLLSLSLSYSNNNEISVCDSRPSSCSAYMFY